MGYLVLKKKHQTEVDNFPMVFAFSNRQFEESMQKLELTASDTDKICSIGGGGFIRKTDSVALKEMFDRHEKEMQAAIDADETGNGFIFEMFNYELANHEYCITWDIEPTLDALGLTVEEVNASPKLKHALQKARRANSDPNCFPAYAVEHIDGIHGESSRIYQWRFYNGPCIRAEWLEMRQMRRHQA